MFCFCSSLFISAGCRHLVLLVLHTMWSWSWVSHILLNLNESEQAGIKKTKNSFGLRSNSDKNNTLRGKWKSVHRVWDDSSAKYQLSAPLVEKYQSNSTAWTSNSWCSETIKKILTIWSPKKTKLGTEVFYLCSPGCVLVICFTQSWVRLWPTGSSSSNLPFRKPKVEQTELLDGRNEEMKTRK